MSAVASAIARSVVALPPEMVTNPSTPSRSAWSKHLKVRDSSRPVWLPASPINGRTADQAARSSACATAGTSLEPSSTIVRMWSSGRCSSSGSSTTQELVPITLKPRCGSTMSPSPDLCSRLTTMWHQRPRTATSTPGEHRTGTSTPAISAIR